MTSKKTQDHNTRPLFPMDQVAQWVRTLPLSARSTAERLSKQTLFDDIKELHAAIDLHVRKAIDAQRKNEFLNMPLCEDLAKQSHLLVNELARLNGAAKQAALVALHYFVFAEDGESDFDSPIGFEDDRDVLASAIAFIKETLPKP